MNAYLSGEETSHFFNMEAEIKKKKEDERLKTLNIV